MNSLPEIPEPLFPGTGWPWESVPSGPATLALAPKHRISVVTPSFNQGRFLEQTIRSVLLQGYPNLEYIVIDGGSKDESVEVLKHYSSCLQYWVSEPDSGQAAAINKGLKRTTGEIIAYINSDDFYLPGALGAVSFACEQVPEADLFHGRCRFIDESGNRIGEHFGSIRTFAEIVDLWGVWWEKRQLVQPEVFWTRRIMDRVGRLNENLHYAMDYDYWTRMLAVEAKIAPVDYPLATFRFHPNQKSSAANNAAQELLAVVKGHLWKATSKLSWAERFRLQNRWLYHSVFLKRVTESLARDEGTIARYITLLDILFTYPQIMLDRGFQSRILSLFNYGDRMRRLL